MIGTLIKVLNDIHQTHHELLQLITLTNRRVDEVNARINDELQYRDEQANENESKRRFQL